MYCTVGTPKDPVSVPYSPLFLVFSLVRETWSTRAAAIQNAEIYRIEDCPDCHLAQINLRKDADEHVLHCDGSL
jgi:hypothetical protein